MEKNLKDLKIIGISIIGRIRETHIFFDEKNDEIGRLEFKLWGKDAVYKSKDEELKLIKRGWPAKRYCLIKKDKVLLSGKQTFLSRNASIYLPDDSIFKLKIAGYRRPYVLMDIDKNEDLFSIGIKRIAPPDIEIKIISDSLKDILLSSYLIILTYFTWVSIKRSRMVKF